MREQYLAVITSDSVGLSVEDEPSTSNGIIDEEVLSSFKVEAPWVSGIFNGIDDTFTWSSTFYKADGHIAIVFGSGEEAEE